MEILETKYGKVKAKISGPLWYIAHEKNPEKYLRGIDPKKIKKALIKDATKQAESEYENLYTKTR